MKRFISNTLSMPFYCLGVVVALLMTFSAIIGEYLLNTADAIKQWGRE